MKRDYYEILGVSRSVSAEELKRTFRKQAMDCHPDRHPDDPVKHERFIELSEAYGVLSDAEKRRSYDMFGHAGVNGGGGGDPFAGFGGFGDIFETFFGGGSSASARARASRGDDLRYDLTITFEEAYRGTEREIDVPRLTTCARCSGAGAEPGTGADRCGTCNGSGQVRRAAQSIFGQVVNVTACPTCRGEGQVLKHPCSECRGQGRSETRRRLSIRIPPGVDTGSQIRLTGEGEAGYRSGASGDLYVVLRVKAHPHLRRQDDNVIYELRINMVQAALGDEIEVPSLDGPVEVSIPPGTQYGQTFRLPGKGMPAVRGGRRGDQYVVVQVVVPKDLNSDQKNLLRKVGGVTGQPEKVSKGFFEKLREAISLD